MEDELSGSSAGAEEEDVHFLVVWLVGKMKIEWKLDPSGSES